MFAGGASGQVASPVYVDDSPAATEGLERISEHASRGDLEKAVRLAQELLVDEGRRLVLADGDPDLYTSVRRRVERSLAARPELLESYRNLQEPAAARLLDEGLVEEASRTRWLTPSGYEASVRVAQRQLESAQFEAALISLEALSDHPDHRMPRADAAVELLELVSSFNNSTRATALLDKWKSDFGIETSHELGRYRFPNLHVGRSPLQNGEQVDLEEMIARPFWTEPLTIRFEQPRMDRTSPNAFGANTVALHVMPTVADDTIYVNDSQAITAWDRFTMALRWRVRFTPLMSNERGGARASVPQKRSIDDLNTVAVSGPWLVATTGLATQGRREGDPRIHGLDARTGEVHWSVDPMELDASLAEALFRGPPVIVENVVIAPLVKQIRQRRLVSVHLVGLDVATGELLWKTQLGSRGTLPFAGGPLSERTIPADGVVYHANRLGFAAAVEAATGKVRWVRRIGGDTSKQTQGQIWQMGSCAKVGDTLYVLSPDRLEIIALDIETGEEISRRSSDDFSRRSLRYLLPAEDRLLVVGDDIVFALAQRNFEDAAVRPQVILETPAQGIRGMVVVMGDEIAAPVRGGVTIARIDGSDRRAPRLRPLDSPGNILPVQGQLISTDDAAVHSYLIWDVAERILSDRMDATSNDPTPAATYAELAYRAGRFEGVAPALDRAIGVIERAPLDSRNRETRERLFASVLAMVEPVRVESEAARSRELGEQLVDRLGRLASTPDERMMHLLVSGSHYERTGRPTEAVSAYQAILADQSLAQVTTSYGASLVQGESEATRRLRRLVLNFGRSVYGAFDAEAQREMLAARGALDPEVFESIARRYPVSLAAPRAWLEAGVAYATRGRPHGAVHSFDSGLDAAEFSLDSSDPVMGELAGRLVRSLVNTGRLSAASVTMERLADGRPTLLMTVNGSPIDVAGLQEEIRSQLQSQDRRPRIGLLETDPKVQLLEGWVLMHPLVNARSSAAASYAMLRTEVELSLWTASSGGGLRERWSAPYDDGMVALAITDDAVYLAEVREEGRVVSRLNLATGRTEWTSLPFSRSFRRQAGDGVPDAFDLDSRVDIPLHGSRPLHELLVAMDDETLAIVERSGRALAIDLRSGRTLWKNERLMRTVYDIAASASALLIGGDNGDPANVDSSRPALLSVDLRTGRVLQHLPADVGRVRWVRITPEGAAVAGMEKGIAAMDMFNGATLWVVGREAGRRTFDAWPFPGRLIVVNDTSQLWQIETEDGRALPSPLRTADKVGVDPRHLRAARIGDLAAFSSPEGILLYERDGSLVGMDQRTGIPSLAPAAFGESHIVLIDRQTATRGKRPADFELMILSGVSGAMLERRTISLGVAPEDVVLIDDRILITAGDATVVIEARRQ